MDLEGDLIPCLPLELALDCLLRVPLQSHHKLRQVCRRWKALLQSPAFYKARRRSRYTEKYACMVQATGPASSNIGDRVKAPLYGVSVYNAKQKAWETLPPIDGLPHGLPPFCQCAAVGSSLVLLGGLDPFTWAVLKCVYVYSFRSATWRRGADMKSARSFFACASLPRSPTILVVGGHDCNKIALKTAEAYDVIGDKWVNIADMPEGRDECKAVGTAANKLLVLSGYGTDSQGQFTRSVDSFDFNSDVRKREDKMCMPGTAPSCVVAHERRVYALAGGKLLVMREEEDGWEEVGAIPTQVSVGPCAASSEGGILVMGCGGTSLPYEAFLCRLCGGSPPSWQKLNVPSHFARLVQVACTVEA